MLDELKQRVCRANRRLPELGLVIQTWGNVSGLSDNRRHMAIKPSGVAYERLTPEMIVIVSVETGEVVEGDLKPSSDAPTHLELYRAFDAVGGIVHTHSLHATAWAQAGREIPPLGTTHADYFPGPAPLTRPLVDGELGEGYEANTGRAIVERFEEFDPAEVPGVLVAYHGPFAWGPSPEQAVEAAQTLEFLAEMAGRTLAINAYPKPASPALLERHFRRKHGPDATYGQD